MTIKEKVMRKYELERKSIKTKEEQEEYWQLIKELEKEKPEATCPMWR